MFGHHALLFTQQMSITGSHGTHFASSGRLVMKKQRIEQPTGSELERDQVSISVGQLRATFPITVVPYLVVLATVAMSLYFLWHVLGL